MYTTCYIVLGFLLLQLQTTIVNADGDTEGWKNHGGNWWNYDLENYPIQLRTEYEVGSGEKLQLYFNDDVENDAGDIYIYFENPLKYELYGCSGVGVKWEFPTEVPAELAKVWTFTLSRDDGERRVVIHCNDKEVLNWVMSDETCKESYWRDHWDLDVAQVYIWGGDGFYRPGPCLAGKYRAESGCESCPEGKTSPAGSHSIADCKEEEDVEGPCLAGEYGAESGCESCPEGKTSPAGSHSIADCKEEEDVEDEKREYSGALFSTLSGIIMTFPLTLLIC